METKVCQNCKNEFTISEKEFIMYKKINLVIPDICVYCRWKQHMAFWPFGKFRTGISDLSGERLITVLPENARYPIYTSKEWWGDGWDSMDYGQDYDSKRSFFEQLSMANFFLLSFLLLGITKLQQKNLFHLEKRKYCIKDLCGVITFLIHITNFQIMKFQMI